MSNVPVTRPRRIGRRLRALLTVALVLGAVAALGVWWLWPPQPYVTLPGSEPTSPDPARADGTLEVDVLAAPQPGVSVGVEFSRDGALIAAARFDRVLVWETATGRLRFILPDNDGVAAVSFSPDGRYLAAPGQRLKLFDLTTGNERPLPIADLAHARTTFSPDGRTLLATAADGNVWLVDLATGEHWSPSTTRPALRPRGAVNQWGVTAAPCQFSPDGRWLVAEEDGSLHVFDVAARAERAAYSGVAGQLAFAPDGSAWAVAVGNEVRVCAAPVGEERWVLRGHTAPVMFLAWSPDGKRLASIAGGDPGQVKVWDADGGRELATLAPQDPYRAVRFSPDGRFLCLAAVGFDGRQGELLARDEMIPLWDLSTAPPRHAVWVGESDVAAPNNTHLAGIGDADVPVRPWTIAQRVRQTTWAVSPGPDLPAFTPDGKMVVLQGRTKVVRGKLGDWLARGEAGPEGYQYKWVDTDTWRVRAVLDTGGPGVLSRDGRLLATGGGGKAVRLWRVPPRRPLGPVLALLGLGGLLAVFIVRARRRRARAGSAAPAVDAPPSPCS